MIATVEEYVGLGTPLLPDIAAVDIDEQIKYFKKEIEECLPVETENIEQLELIVAELEIAKLGIYEWIPFEPISSRNELGQPTFAVFDVNNRVQDFELILHVGSGPNNPVTYVTCNQQLPRQMMDRYKDIEPHLFSKAGDKRNCEITLSTHFSGIIPRQVRDKIKAAQQAEVFSRIFLIAEVKPEQWAYSQKPQVTKPSDPLVVGFANEKMYLIGSFLPTTAEKLWESQATSQS